MTTQRVECITIPCLRWLGDFDKPKGFRRYGTVFFMRIENISIEDNWCMDYVQRLGSI